MFYCCIADDARNMVAVFAHNEMKDGIRLRSLTPAASQMHIFEREIHENFGVEFAGHPWLKPLRFQPSMTTAAEPVEEKTEFDVVIKDPGAKKIDVIKVIRQLTSLGLGEAKTMAETAGGKILTGVSKEAAHRSLREEHAQEVALREGKLATAQMGRIWRFFHMFTERKWATVAVIGTVIVAGIGLIGREDLKIGDLDPGAPDVPAGVVREEPVVERHGEAAQAEALRSRYFQSLLTLARLADNRGDYDMALKYYDRIARKDNYMEVAHRGIMEAYLSHSPMLVITDTSDTGMWQLGSNQAVTGEYGTADLWGKSVRQFVRTSSRKPCSLRRPSSWRTVLIVRTSASEEAGFGPGRSGMTTRPSLSRSSMSTPI